MLIQGYPLRASTSPHLTTLLAERCSQMHIYIKSRSDQSGWNVPEPHNGGKSDKHGLCGLIGEVLCVLKLQRSRRETTPGEYSGYDNCKNGKRVEFVCDIYEITKIYAFKIIQILLNSIYLI